MILINASILRSILMLFFNSHRFQNMVINFEFMMDIISMIKLGIRQHIDLLVYRMQLFHLFFSDFIACLTLYDSEE